MLYIFYSALVIFFIVWMTRLRPFKATTQKVSVSGNHSNTNQSHNSDVADVQCCEISQKKPSVGAWRYNGLMLWCTECTIAKDLLPACIIHYSVKHEMWRWEELKWLQKLAGAAPPEPGPGPAKNNGWRALRSNWKNAWSAVTTKTRFDPLTSLTLNSSIYSII